MNQSKFDLQETISKHKFKPTYENGGYDATDVDRFFDLINLKIKAIITENQTNYAKIMTFDQEMTLKNNEISELKAKIIRLQKKLDELEESGYNIVKGQ